jgi:dihydrofolate reductase
MQTTLDGRISRPDGFFWEPFPWGDEEMSYVNQFFAAADTWVMSRKLYEFVVPYWEQVAAGTAPDIGVPDSPARNELAHILTGLTKVVFSRTLSDDPSTRRVVRSGDLIAHLRELKAQDGGDLIGSFGPATLGPLASTPGLIDEYLIVVHPAVLTDGPGMFEYATRDLGFTLQAAQVFGGGAAHMRYRTLESA